MHPVANVNWDDIQPSLARLNVAFEEGGMRFCLPTEAQWERACRAGTTTAFGFGDNPAMLAQHGCFDGNARGSTHPVGQGNPNTWGLYDMHGNVWERCSDRFGADYYGRSPSVDPIGPPTGKDRVYRGGSWRDGPERCRSAARFWNSPDKRQNNIGFRVALVQAEKFRD
jgi:formylglycine-generating enzyme required for sulfatase activity